MDMRPVERREGIRQQSNDVRTYTHRTLQLSALACSTACPHRYTKPLTPEFQAAADKLAKQQAELDAHMRGRQLDQARARMQGP